MQTKTLYDFTPRQRQILQIFARMDGAPDRKIANELNLAVGTMKVYVHQIMERAGEMLAARNRTALSAMAAKLVAENAKRQVLAAAAKKGAGK
jgi:DNA-binding NarL/FixJ family response regulator